MSETQVAVKDESQALARATDLGGAGTLAMAMMSEHEFQSRLAALKCGQDRIQAIKRELMQEGVHYGVIPGTKKPTLLKPGAEVLCSIYGLRPDFVPTVQYGDGVTAPSITVLMRCELHLGDTEGPVVAVGYGAANSWEAKHRYRQGQRACPECGQIGAVIKGKEEYGGGWLCWPKAKQVAGCGAKFLDDDPRILGQACGQVENVDPYDLLNTLVKMGKKRAHLDAALTGTASSDLFTQDLDEVPPAGPQQSDGAQKPHAASASEQQERDEQAGPRCPKCNKPGRVSQFQKPGATHYCPTCKVRSSTGKDAALTFAAAAPREPGDDDAEDAPAPPAASPAATPSEPLPALPRGSSKPSCPTCKNDRSVICNARGVWGCSKAKGGCGRELARAAA